MEVSLNANTCDHATRRIAEVLEKAFAAIEDDLRKDYGGTIQHLWIDFELVEDHARRRAPFPFRFQKKVGGSRSRLTGLPTPVCENVGHYSVRPDFSELLSTPIESVAGYALSLIFGSTAILVEQQERLGGFDAHRFRADLLAACGKHGYQITGPGTVG
jgi:hypothetical protein